MTGYMRNSFDEPFPTTTNAFQPEENGSDEAFVVVLDGTGALVYSTHLGGHAHDHGRGITAYSSGRIYVVGWTESDDFPLKNALDSYWAPIRDREGFIVRFSASGDLDYSTYYGGDSYESLEDIHLDGYTNVYFVGYSYYDGTTHIPLKNAYQKTRKGRSECVVGSLNSSGTSWRFSSYLGGSGYERCFALALDSKSHLYIAGQTTSTLSSFPTTGSGYVKHGPLGGKDLFVTKIPYYDRQKLAYMVRVGGQGTDDLVDMVRDGAGNLYLTGDTQSPDVPVLGSLQTFNQGASTTAWDGYTWSSSPRPIERCCTPRIWAAAATNMYTASHWMG